MALSVFRSNKWPKALEDMPYSPDSAAGRAVSAALRKAGIDDDTPETSHNEEHTRRYRTMDVHRIYPGEDGELRDHHLHATMNQKHDMINHVFKTRDGKHPNVKTQQSHKKGKITISDLPFSSSSVPGLTGLGLGGLGDDNAGMNGLCTCPLCTGSSPYPKAGCECPLCLPSSSSLGPGLGALGLGLLGGGANSPAFGFQEEPRAPRTIEDLMDLLRVHKPGKKIVQIAGDADIVETKVTMLQIEPGVMGPGVLVLCAGGLPDQKRILQNPLLNQDWAVGPAGPGQQKLVLKITKKVHIHIHFVLKLAVPTF
ncbi:hypothetical protein JCM10908_001527 [Rhodotorula pacifica]|uniref:uncharacterized protein n=1 Tax=Rhodotorula pacifica TaxID=1495444 RepID=UPI00317249BC